MAEGNGNRVSVPCCESPGPFGIGKDVEIGERVVFDKVTSLGELGGGFAREASHDVGADGRIGHKRVSNRKTAGIVASAVLAKHPLQYSIGAGLQREMNVFRDARFGGDEFQKVVTPIHRFD